MISSEQSAAVERGTRMLRTALGPAVARFLEDPAIVEVMLNPDGRLAAIVKEVLTNEASVLVDSDAANKATDADLALQELGADYAGEAYVTATVTVWDTG